MPVYVDVRHGPFAGVSKVLVRRWAERMLKSLDLGSTELSLAITNDVEIHELNRTYRKKDKPTDVLAFAMREGEPLGAAREPKVIGPRGRREKTETPALPEMLGDVVVSVETARRQAAQHRRPLEAELRMLIAHGLLHLVGYDHQTDAQERVMTQKTRELCKAALAKATPAV